MTQKTKYKAKMFDLPNNLKRCGIKYEERKII